MNNLESLIGQKRIGVVSAHPDDHLVHSNLLAVASELDTEIHELTLTLGRESSVNYREDELFVQNGLREYEGLAAAKELGITSDEHWDLPDGYVREHIDSVAPQVEQWMAHHALDVVLTMGGLTDHSDHSAASAMAVAAGNQRGVFILELQSDTQGELLIPSTKYSVERAMAAAALHVSQFRSENLANLEQYPIWRDATYRSYAPQAAALRFASV